MNTVKYVIGIEAGESGGRALSHILNKLPDSNVTYMRDHDDTTYNSGVLPWKIDEKRAERKYRSLCNLSKDCYSLIGDVGYYYLNYVEYLLVQLPELYVVAVYRDRQANIKSLERKVDIDCFGDDNGNHIYYPTITNVTIKEDILAQYYDFYSNAIDAFLIYYPKRVMAIDIEDLLTSSDGIKEIQSFLSL